MEPPSLQLRISYSNSTSVRIPRSVIARAIELILPSPGSVAIALVDDNEMRELNRQYRGVDESTDVLTFPAPPIPGSHLVGDIAICVDFARRQASLRKVSIRTEIAYLAIHGLLHLKGLDDETDSDRLAMMREMGRVGKLVGLPEDGEWASIAKGAAA
ncbi:MAG: rRNA maturation RNase YbeY [Fimbriimonadaceae bacterium]